MLRSNSQDLPKMGTNESVLVLDFETRIEEAMHELEQVLMVIEKSTPIHVVQIEVEEALLQTALQEFLELSRLLR